MFGPRLDSGRKEPMRPRLDALSGATRRPILLVAGLLYLLSLVIGQAHVAIEMHTVCVEHGELVEVSGGDALASCGSAAAPAGDRDAAFARASDAGEPEHGHDHCPIAWITRERPDVASAAAILPVDDAAALVAFVPPSTLHAPSDIPLYRLAPKHSPPAV